MQGQRFIHNPSNRTGAALTAVLIGAVGMFWFVLVFYFYVDFFGLNYFRPIASLIYQFTQPLAEVRFDYLLNIGILMVLMFISYSLGGTAFKILGIKWPFGLERLMLNVVLGLLILSLFTFFLGILSLLYGWLFYVIFATLTGLCALPVLLKILAHNPFRGQRLNFARVETLMLIVLAILFIVGLLYSLTPAMQSDGVRYHLTAPQEYIKHHQIHYLKLNANSNFPFTIEMLFLLAMLLSGPELAQLIHYSTLWLCALLLVCLARYGLGYEKQEQDKLIQIPESVAIWVFLTTPVVFIVACWPFVDLGVCLFFLATIYGLLRWQTTRNNGFLIASAIFAGAAAGSKYTMFIFILFSSAFVFWAILLSPPARLWWRKVKTAAIKAGLYLFIALVLASPWLIKNTIYTGNPVYPLLYDVFDGQDWSNENAQFYQDKTAEKGRPRTLGNFITLPWNVSFYWMEFGQFNPGIVFLLFTPFLAELILTSLTVGHKRPEWRTLSLFTIFFLLIWYFSYQDNRFLIPLFALLSLMVGEVINKTRNLSTAPYKTFLFVVLFGGMIGALWTSRWILIEAQPHPMPVALGFETKHDYLSQALNYYPCARYLNSVTETDEKVLFVGEHRGMYCQFEYLASDWFDTPYILWLIRHTRDNEQLFAYLKKEKVNYVLFNLAELRLYLEDYFRPRFTAEEYERFEKFLQAPRLRRIFPPGPGLIYVSRIE